MRTFSLRCRPLPVTHSEDAFVPFTLSRYTSADAEQLEEWAEELVIAESLDEVFGQRD
jgi:hypothetical protein